MGKIEEYIMSLGGHQYRTCYRDLCWAIFIEMENMPDSLQMKFIAAEICERTHKRSPASVWRSVARAVEDLWASGDREALVALHNRWKWYRPKPQEFIYVIAWKLRHEELRHE